jgi:putative hydrolase of the HAD superfamily
MAKIRAVFLDVGWTLAYPRVSMWEIFARLCTEAGVPTTPEACEQLVRTLFSSSQGSAEQQFRAGAQYADSDEAFTGMFVRMGRLVFSQMGVPDGHAGLMQRFLQAFWNDANWVAFPEVPQVLGALRHHGVKLGVLSNAPSDLPKFLDRLGITPLLDFSVVSAIEGVKKPDRRIFATAVARAGVAPEDALHVGDMYLEDVLGGRAAGLTTLLIERGPHAMFPNFRESDERPIEPEAVVTDLFAVLHRLH